MSGFAGRTGKSRIEPFTGSIRLFSFNPLDPFLPLFLAERQ
jgi:hypothetical protein